MDIRHRTVVLTGATGGIGRAMAQALDNAGAQLLLVARNEHELEKLYDSLSSRRHGLVAADITTTEGRAAVLAACADACDILINNAGVNHFGLLENLGDDQLRQTIEVNVIAPMLLSRQLLPLLTRSQGAIVNVGSGYGSIGFAGYTSYCASKFALRGFSEALGRELSDTGVRIMYLAPRAVETEMNPPQVVAMNAELGNSTDAPATVAAELLEMLGKNQLRRYIGWPEKFFIRLNGLFPGLVDSALAKQLPLIRKQAIAVATDPS